MAVKLNVPTPMRQYANKRSEVDLTPGTLDQVFEQLVNNFPELRRHLFNDEGRLRSFVNIYLNDEDVRYLGHGWAIQNEHVRVSHQVFVGDGDVISIVPSIETP